MTRYPAFDESDYRDYEAGNGLSSAFAWCDHALAALREGDADTALETLAVRRATGELADQVGGEAENLIRAGLLSDAERRLACVVEPKFASHNDARKAYRRAQQHQRALRLASAA